MLLTDIIFNMNKVGTIKYWFEGDTIIENKRYTKVYRQYCQSESECGDLQYYAAVREDTLNAKIYAFRTCYESPYSHCDDETLIVVQDKIYFATVPELYTYEIYSNLGIRCASGKATNPIDASPLSAGIYYLIFFDNNNVKISVNKFVKL